MGTEMLSNEEIVDYYKEDAMKLFHYLSWLESKMGQRTSTVYGADGIATNSIPFPVYDSTLLSFIKEADKTCFMDRNYVYVYTRNRLKNYRDELRLIEKATIRDMDKMAGIMNQLRENPPAEIGGYAVVKVTDYKKPEETGLPAANVLIYALEGGATVVVRPSGTEPKIKTYFTTLGKDLAEAQAQKDALAAALKPIFS